MPNFEEDLAVHRSSLYDAGETGMAAVEADDFPIDFMQQGK